MIRRKYLFNDYQLKISNKLNSILDIEKNILTRSCILCENNNFEKVSNVDRYGIKYFTGICKKCGLMQQYKYPNKEFTDLFYEKYYNDLYAFFKNPEERFISQFNSAKYKFDILKDFINFKNDTNVLEIGCGAGGILAFFKSKNCKVIGIDYENEHLEYARKKNITTYTSYEKINKKFDLIILSHVLEHLVYIDDILNVCKNLIKKDGLIYIEVPSIESISKHYDYDIQNFLHIAHVTHFTKSTFINFINLKGFNIKFINNKIHSIIFPSKSSDLIIDNYFDTKKIIKNIKIKKLIFLPIENILKMIKNVLKKVIYK